MSVADLTFLAARSKELLNAPVKLAALLVTASRVHMRQTSPLLDQIHGNFRFIISPSPDAEHSTDRVARRLSGLDASLDDANVFEDAA